jgi:predicted nucleic acid-binding protein
VAHYFFDTSALVKFYHAEVGTNKVSAIFSEQGRQIRISSIGLIEVQSAFAMKVRAGVIDSRLAGQQRAALMLDVASGGIEVYSVNQHHFKHAERLIGKYGATRRLRTLDALQLAVALDLLNQNLLDHFVVADRPLAEVAVLEGLSVVDPQIP